jgi:hypothetical protein
MQALLWLSNEGMSVEVLGLAAWIGFHGDLHRPRPELGDCAGRWRRRRAPRLRRACQSPRAWRCCALHFFCCLDRAAAR